MFIASSKSWYLLNLLPDPVSEPMDEEGLIEPFHKLLLFDVPL